MRYTSFFSCLWFSDGQGVYQPARKYEPRPYEEKETADLLLFGEEPKPQDHEEKYARVLSRFAFFDPKSELEMVSLNVLSDRIEKDRKIEGAGFVAAKFLVDEDEGQEDLEAEDDELQYIRLTAVRRYLINYLFVDAYVRFHISDFIIIIHPSPLYVETDHAIYELIQPSKKYRREFRSFYKPHRVMQLVIASAYEDPEQEVEAFFTNVTSLDILEQPLVERDVWDVVGHSAEYP